MVGGAKPKSVGQAAANPYLHLLQQYMEALLPRGSGGQLNLPAQIWKRLLPLEAIRSRAAIFEYRGTSWLLECAGRLVSRWIGA